MKNNSYLQDNATVREEVLNLKLFYELKKAAAERKYHLKIFTANVDFEGFDIIIDDNNLTGKYQIKTKWNSKVSRWGIQRNMLSPTIHDAKKMRVGNGESCSNVEKGVILLDIVEKDGEIHFDYYFTNFYIIKAISHKLIRRPKPTYEIAEKKMSEILTGLNPNEKLIINKGLFVKLKNPMCLLAICGFDNTINVHPKMRLLELFEENKINYQGIEETELYQSNLKVFQNEMGLLTY